MLYFCERCGYLGIFVAHIITRGRRYFYIIRCSKPAVVNICLTITALSILNLSNTRVYSSYRYSINTRCALNIGLITKRNVPVLTVPTLPHKARVRPTRIARHKICELCAPHRFVIISFHIIYSIGHYLLHRRQFCVADLIYFEHRRKIDFSVAVRVDKPVRFCCIAQITK